MRDRKAIALAVATILFAGLAVFQFALGLGAPLGRAAWGGGQDVLPPALRIGSAFAILTYAAFVWLPRRRVARPGVAGPSHRRMSRLRLPARRHGAQPCLVQPVGALLMAPVALALAVAAFIVARGPLSGS